MPFHWSRELQIPSTKLAADKILARGMTPRGGLHGKRLGLPDVIKRLRRFSYICRRYRPTSRHYRLITLFSILSLTFLEIRQLGLVRRTTTFFLANGDILPSNFVRGNPSYINGSASEGTGEGSLHLWRRLDSNCPAEKDVPDPQLYGTGGEVCYVVGRPDTIDRKIGRGDPAPVWQMNSRAFCVINKPSCLYGNRLDNFLTFERRGTAACKVVSVSDGSVKDLRNQGLNESCAAFRQRFVATMYGTEVFSPYDKWYASVSHHFKPQSGTSRKPILWASQFAIVIPKYPWSYNIFHYFRIWSYVVWVVRNLRLFVPDADRVKHIHILNRAGYQYKLFWHTGLRDAVVAAIQRELGISLTVGKLRYNSGSDFQCLHRAIWLGREGRVDAFPYFNDSSVWSPSYQRNDTHWPIIPHDSLWLRQVVSTWAHLPPIGSFRGDIPSHFDTIPVPPRRIGVLMRSPRSKRHLTRSGEAWFFATLHDLADKHGLEVQRVRTSSSMSFRDQVAAMREIGLAVGLHGANFVNTIFMPAAGALFEIFPYRYVRYYYAAGGNSGLRYSFHEPEGGADKNCSFEDQSCFRKYRETTVFLTARDRTKIRQRLEKAMLYIARLHEMYPDGYISLRREGNFYQFGHTTH